MYVLKDVKANKYLTYTGWLGADDNGVLDLSTVIRFTANEAAWNTVDESEYKWIYYGSYTDINDLRKEYN